MRRILIHSILLAVVTLAVFWQVSRHSFVNFDDNTYVTGNRHVTSGLTGENLAWAVTATTEANWHPLTWISHMADCQLFGLDPRGHHLTNLLLHLVNTLLLQLLLFRLTGAVWRSTLVAGLFALHPLHVESVAWIAERKDVLSALFGLLTVLSYHRYVTRRGAWRYGLVLLLFALGLTAKPMLVTLPCVLLLLDYWPLGRFRSSETATGRTAATWLLPVLEKLPLLLLSSLSSTITYYAQSQASTIGILLPLKTRVMTALLAYGGYLEKMFWPTNLAILYPFTSEIPLWEAVAATLLLAAITVAVVVHARRYPYLPVGWFWYLGTLVPVIGLVQVGLHSMADRYTYLPLVGPFIMIAWGGADLARSCRLRPAVPRTAAVVLLLLVALVTWRHLATWRDSVTLFSHAVEVTDKNYVAYYNLGEAYLEQKRYPEAMKCYRQSLLINQLQPQAYNSLGIVLAAQGFPEEAVPQYRQAIRISHGFADAYTNLGRAEATLRRFPEARAAYEESLRIRPDDKETLHRFGFALAEEGDLGGAIRCFTRLVEVAPEDAAGQYNLGLALMRQGNHAAAIDRFSAALTLRPGYRGAEENRAECRRKMGKR